MSAPYQIDVRSGSQSLSWPALTPVLESLLPVKFVPATPGASTGVGQLNFDDPAQTSSIQGGGNTSSLSLPSCPRSPAESESSEWTVRFADDADVPFPFRGRVLTAKAFGKPGALTLEGGEKVLAHGEAGPVWSLSTRAGIRHMRSAFALPPLPLERNLRDVLNGEHFFEMLPLIHWLREICAPALYAAPPLRACFMFDDPNLHWPSYGFVDYRQIASHAARENYHVAFATIPLDSWFTHEATVQIFGNNPGQLSLLVHGNDHTKLELARDWSESERIDLLCQAIRRIEGLERRSGLRICRIVAPPHGACSAEMLRFLPRCGFEAACISHGSLRAHNKAAAWTRSLGYRPSEFVHGCAVLPRWALSRQANNSVLLAAFLGQPIILRAHQEDLSEGVEVLDEAARFINRLGSISWSNMTQLARNNYESRLDAELFRLRPLGAKLVFQMPPAASRLVVDLPNHCPWENWKALGSDGVGREFRAGEVMTIPDHFRGSVLLEAVVPSVAPANNTIRRPVVAAFARRLLTEGRDRFLSRIRSRGRLARPSPS